MASSRLCCCWVSVLACSDPPSFPPSPLMPLHLAKTLTAVFPSPYPHPQSTATTKLELPKQAFVGDDPTDVIANNTRMYVIELTKQALLGDDPTLITNNTHTHARTLLRARIQVGATAAVLIASAAAELKRQQQQQELDQEAAETAEAASRMGLAIGSGSQQSRSAGRLPTSSSPTPSVAVGSISASAPPDINAAIAIMAGLEENKYDTSSYGEEKHADEKMMERETYFPLSGGGDDGGSGGMERSRAASLAEPGVARGRLKPKSLCMRRRFSPGGHQQQHQQQRWRGGVLGAPGLMGMSPGGGSVVGAGALGVQCFTCTVGKKPSQARTYVNDIDEVSVCVVWMDGWMNGQMDGFFFSVLLLYL